MRAYCWLYRAFLCLFAISDMTVFMTHLEKNRPGFGIEMKRQGVLFETFRRLRANVQAFYLKCQGVFRGKTGFSGARIFTFTPFTGLVEGVSFLPLLRNAFWLEDILE